METLQPSAKTSTTGIAVAIVLAGAIIAAALYFRPATTPGSSTAGQPAVSPPLGQVAGEQRVMVSVDATDPSLGAADAPVMLVEFSDLECPFCKRYHDMTFRQLKQEYIDTGKVKYVFKHFPLIQIHPHAQRAAEVAQCAAEQGKFWEFADAAFAQQQALAEEDLHNYARTLGVDIVALDECLKNPATAQTVAADQQEGLRVGVNGTPGFFINGVRLEGAQPFESFKAVIEQELAKVQN